MASRRKDFAAKHRAPTRQHTNAEFMAGLLDGTIKATNIQITDGRVVSYDDPDPDRPGAPPDRIP
jgi:hypothetical protein